MYSEINPNIFIGEILICVGTGNDQIPLIKVACELGFTVIAFDQNPNKICQNLNVQLIKCSTYDYEKAIFLIDKLLKDKKPIGVINRSSGPAGISAAMICKKYNITSITSEIALASAEKSKLYKDCISNNVLSPKIFKLKKFQDLQWGNYVIKPDIPIIGKQNVYKPNSSKEAKIYFNRAKDESFNNIVNIQQYVYGIDLIVFVFCFEGNIEKLIILEELVALNDGSFEGIGLFIPPIISSLKLSKSLITIIKKLLVFWKIKSNIISFSFRVDDKLSPWLYEVNSGLCGDNIISTLLPKAYNCSPKDFYIIDILFSVGINKKFKFKFTEEVCLYKNNLMTKEEGLIAISNSFICKELIMRRNYFRNLQIK